jgi:hypothetical protein
MDFNLDCNVAFRRLSSKLSMSYLGFLLLVISCFIYFFCFIEQTSVFHQKVGYQISFINEILFQDGKTRVNILFKKKTATLIARRGLYIKSSPHFDIRKFTRFLMYIHLGRPGNFKKSIDENRVRKIAPTL